MPGCWAGNAIRYRGARSELTTTMQSCVEVYCQFDPLQEVWLGDCYPEEFYQDLDPEIRSIFATITEITKKDLEGLEKILKSLGVTVQRPRFSTNSDDYRDQVGNLLKPPIAPRDDNMALGQDFYSLRQVYKKNPWQHVLDHYTMQGVNVIQAGFLEKYGYLQPASIVRLGKDLLIDYDSHAHSWSLIERDVLPEWDKKFRITVSKTGGHADSVFCVPQPGKIITSHWKSHYQDEFPGWEVFHLPKQKSNLHQENTSWWIEDQDLSHPAFNKYIETRARSWIGSAQETVFEVNSLMINPSLMLTTGIPDDKTAQWLKQAGIDFIPIECRARTFWDSGVHCLTVDIKRQGTQQDLFFGKCNN
jgi:hypothetical protein